jgi:hypothetical protein
MKPIVIFVLVAAVSLGVVAASAKNEMAPGNTDERIVSGVAGPRAAAETSRRAVAARAENKGEQFSKTEREKTKINPKPPTSPNR